MNFARDIVNQVRKTPGAEGRVVCNPINNGYSIKVIGWSPAKYKIAAKLAVEAGYLVKLVKTPTIQYVRGPYGGDIRIHITKRETA
jgi:hypothetical protein